MKGSLILVSFDAAQAIVKVGEHDSEFVARPARLSFDGDHITDGPIHSLGSAVGCESDRAFGQPSEVEPSLVVSVLGPGAALRHELSTGPRSISDDRPGDRLAARIDHDSIEVLVGDWKAEFFHV